MKTKQLNLFTRQCKSGRAGMKKNFLLGAAFMFIFPFMYAQNTVVMYGTSADTSLTQMRYFKQEPFQWSELYYPHPINVSRKNNYFKIKLDVKSPQIFEIFPPGYSRSQIVYVTPGDSVSFKVVPTATKNQYELLFSGKNAAQYNYDPFMWKSFNYKTMPRLKKGMDLDQYKQARLAYKKRQLDSLTHYIRNHVVSKGFVDYAKAQINNEYIVFLYLPLDEKLVSMHDVPEGYFKDATPEKNELSYYYKVALAEKNIYHFTDSPTTHFDAVYRNIMHHFSGTDRAYLLTTMIGYYALKQKPEYHSGLLQAIREVPKYIHNPHYLSYIQSAEKYYSIVNNPFPDSVLNHTYLRTYSSNEKITLKELLNRYKGKPLYLDFWASWCSACRLDIANSHPARQYLAKKNVSYIYISRDTDEKAWLKAAKEDSTTQNQYLLYDVPNAPLLNYLKVKFIPRYILMDAGHDIIEPSAPRPDSYANQSQPSNFDQLKKSIQQMYGEKRVVTLK